MKKLFFIFLFSMVILFFLKSDFYKGYLFFFMLELVDFSILTVQLISLLMLKQGFNVCHRVMRIACGSSFFVFFTSLPVTIFMAISMFNYYNLHINFGEWFYLIVFCLLNIMLPVLCFSFSEILKKHSKW